VLGPGFDEHHQDHLHFDMALLAAAGREQRLQSSRVGVRNGVRAAFRASDRKTRGGVTMGMRGVLGFVVVLAAVVATASPVRAQDLGGTTNVVEPAVALIMPFDVTEGRQSFQLVSRIGGSDAGTIASHWSFWSESCDHLADVFICLTLRDTVVVDPTALQGQIQVGQGNENTGPKIDLSGEKGFVTVTAFDADSNSQTCEPADPESVSATPSLIGSWVVSNTETAATFGNVAIGITDGQTLPAGGDFFPTGPVAAGMFLQTYNPMDLTDSEVFFIGVAFPAGNAQFSESEIGPIPSALANGSAVAATRSTTTIPSRSCRSPTCASRAR
jgi:hypothetical protein